MTQPEPQAKEEGRKKRYGRTGHGRDGGKKEKGRELIFLTVLCCALLVCYRVKVTEKPNQPRLFPFHLLHLCQTHNLLYLLHRYNTVTLNFLPGGCV